jgi:hypothetical protein
VEPNSNPIEVHPQLSNNGHPVDGALVGLGSLWASDGWCASGCWFTVAKDCVLIVMYKKLKVITWPKTKASFFSFKENYTYIPSVPRLLHSKIKLDLNQCWSITWQFELLELLVPIPISKKWTKTKSDFWNWNQNWVQNLDPVLKLELEPESGTGTLKNKCFWGGEKSLELRVHWQLTCFLIFITVEQLVSEQLSAQDPRGGLHCFWCPNKTWTLLLVHLVH